jgi:Lactoylglutathione lyase and related lyases
MRIHHFAIWCDDIELMRAFYMKYFNCTSNSLYHNPKKNFSSYFLSFDGGDCKIELMNRPDINEEPGKRGFIKGIAHFDIEVGDDKKVDELTERLRYDGYTIASEPRKTGDGYYEAGILDPEGNYVEISSVAG